MTTYLVFKIGQTRFSIPVSNDQLIIVTEWYFIGKNMVAV